MDGCKEKRPVDCIDNIATPGHITAFLLPWVLDKVFESRVDGYRQPDMDFHLNTKGVFLVRWKGQFYFPLEQIIQAIEFNKELGLFPTMPTMEVTDD